MTCEKCLGARPYGKKRVATNFCKSCIWDSIVYKCRQGQPFYVYALVDRSKKVVYVGATDNPRKRFTAHTRYKKFWIMRLVQDFQTWEEALLFEAALTKKLNPKYNRLTPKITTDQAKKVIKEAYNLPGTRYGKRQTPPEKPQTSDQSTYRPNDLLTS